MKRRCVEGKHAFAKAIAERFHIFELGGLLLDANWEFTAVVEAFELSREEKDQRLSLLLEAAGLTKDFYMEGVFARQLGVPFYIMTHAQGGSRIRVYDVHPDVATSALQCDREIKLTEEAFLAWWREKKGTTQTKEYREDFEARAAGSYFDDLLERNGLKWGGNIDGCLAVETGGAPAVAAIIENRFTNKKPLSEYDPNEYYHGYNGSDANTWRPLLDLKSKLGVPLFLMTYSRRAGEETMVGITQVLEQSRAEGLIYIQNSDETPLRPCDHIFGVCDMDQLWSWILCQLRQSRTPEVAE